MHTSAILRALAHLSPWHADRAKRLLTYGCPRETVLAIACMLESPAERDGRLTAEEVKLLLPPMQPQAKTPMDKLQGDLAHALRVVGRMENREQWFISRITQLETHCKSVMNQLSEAKRASASASASASAQAKGPLNISQHVVDLDLPEHERIAKQAHVALLRDEGIEGGMTPRAPLLPIPTHSLKKAVSWGDLQENPFDTGDPVLRSCYEAGLFDCKKIELGPLMRDKSPTMSSDLLDLAHLAQTEYDSILAEDFTCIRTDGRIERGWTIPRTAHYCKATDPMTAWKQRAFAFDRDGTKFFMTSGGCAFPCMKEGHDGWDTCQHACGWRRCHAEKRTFWPSRLTTEAEKTTWWEWLDGRVAFLKEQKLIAEAAAEAAEEAAKPPKWIHPNFPVDHSVIEKMDIDELKRCMLIVGAPAMETSDRATLIAALQTAISITFKSP